MKKTLLLLGILVASHFGLRAQIDVVDNQTAQALAQTLVGQGVVMLNPTLNCPGVANGKFSVIASNLGLDSGIVLTSGRALTLGATYGVNGVPGNGASNTNNVPGDADLTTLINLNLTGTPIPTRDACILEFDFVPAGDTVKFDYVFGSDEYTTYNCSINDVFGFFISGPGIVGSRNIALVPGTTNVMVGISTINDGTGGYVGSPCDLNTFGAGPYTSFYVDNTPSTTMVYNGITQTLQAISGVIPCDTFHLKLAIADASDYILDSGVFLKAGSLNSTGISLTPESTNGGDDTLAHCIRGCKSGFIRFARPAVRPTPLTVKFLISGSAVNGVDYQTITDSVVIPANQLSTELEIKPRLVQFPSGTKEVIIRALSPYTCGNGQANVIDTAIMYIHDSLYVNIPTPPITVCPNNEISITADIDSTLNYYWTPAALIPDPLPLGLTIHPKPTVTTGYSITVSQPGAPATCPPVKRTYTANVEPLPQIQLPSKDTTICFADSVDFSISSLPSGVNYQYNWSPGTYLRDNTSANNKFFGPVGDYKYVITATTPIAGCSNKDSFMIHVVAPFEFEYVTPVDTTIRYGDQIQFDSESEAIYWLWSPITYLNDPTAKSPYAKPLKSTLYTLIGINQYGCKDTAEVNVKVEYMPNSGMPNAFSPNGDGLNDIFKIENLRFDKLTEFRIFNRYGQMVFETLNPEKGWDGTQGGKPAATDVYFYTVKLTLPDGTERAFKGEVTLIR
jgi:gliding motility-associated-like protein